MYNSIHKTKNLYYPINPNHILKLVPFYLSHGHRVLWNSLKTENINRIDLLWMPILKMSLSASGRGTALSVRT